MRQPGGTFTYEFDAIFESGGLGKEVPVKVQGWLLQEPVAG